MSKDYSAAGSCTGRAAPELLLKFLFFGVSYSVQSLDLYIFIGVFGTMLLLVP